MSIADAKAALDGGSVDAALIAGAAAYQAKQQGYHMVADGEGLIKAIIAVAVREDFYEKNRDVIDRFMEAQKRVAAFMKDNQDEVLQIVAEELDLKKAAKAVGEKSLEMIHVKDINQITGYIRGGCTAVGMKKQYKTVIDASAQTLQTMIVSGGRIGSQIELTPEDLAKAANAVFAEIIA